MHPAQRYTSVRSLFTRKAPRGLRYALPLAILFATATASAQSAADKATARKLATEGIQLFQQGKYPESLERLQRAESLYDAPVHLLYIARAQVKLNQLIDAAETYRRLVRVTLEPNAPVAFKQAIESAKKELETLEPTVPALRIDVEPANVQGLELTINGQNVSAAAVGVDRPINPGLTTVVASAPGYKPAQAEVEMKPGGRENVRLVLQADASAAAPVVPANTQMGTEATPQPAVIPEARTGKGVGFFVGLRLAAAIPTGSLFQSALNGQELKMGDYFKTGGGLELHGGIRFLRYFGVKLFFEGYQLTPGAELDNVANYAARVDVTNKTSAVGFGASAIVGLLDRGKFGAFGEIGFASQSFSITQAFEDADLTGPVCPSGSEDKTDLSGGAFRIGGGANIPVGKFVHLTPYVMAEIGKFTTLDFESGCAERARRTDTPPGEYDIEKPAFEQKFHQLFLIGIGGDFIFGKGP